VRRNVAEVKDISRGYAVEAWLARFPGFVDDLADRLRAYSAGLAGAASVYAADRLQDEPLDPCGPYYVLLSQLRTSRDGGQVSEEDYEWFRTRARTAMAEVAKAALSGAPAAPAASAPSAVPASLRSVQDLRLPCVFHRTLPPSRLCQLLPIRVALAPMRLLRLVVLRRASWCLAALPLRLVPVRAAGSGRVLRRLFQVGFIMFVFLLASVVPAYIFRSALSVRQAIRDARTGRLPGPVSGARLRVVCARVLPVSPVSRLLVPRWCRCLRLRWCPRRPCRPLHLPLRLPGLLLLLRSRRPFLRRLQRLAALPIGAVRLRGLRPPSVIPSPSSSLLGSSIVCRWRSLCCALLVLCSGGPVVREKGRRERRNKYIVARSRLLAFLFVFLNARMVISKQNFLIDREIELVSKR
jgi:hypothetical protein